jgi:hypothetical protein
LRYFINKRSYDEIYTQTNAWIWNAIYKDPGIAKHEFIPVLLEEWERYWDKLYFDIDKEIGRTSHLDEMKEKSFRQLNAFIKTYSDTPNIIELAYDIDDMLLFPLAVIAMLQIFDEDTCYDEYCEFEFESDDWESICVYEDDDFCSEFYIKPYDL